MGKKSVISQYLAKLGRAGGTKSAASLTKKQRIERARTAGLAAAKARQKKGGAK
jgi:hypothetical protein